MAGKISIGEPAWLRAASIAAVVIILVVLLIMPLAAIIVEAFTKGGGAVLDAWTRPDARQAILLTAEITAIVVPVNTVFGIGAAWCLAHYRFAGRRLLRALIALPFSISPVVAGLTLALLFGRNGWLGPFLAANGIRVIFAVPGIVIATIFVTLPLVAGQVYPVMEAIGSEEEQAALTLGAGFRQILWRITLPRIRWGVLAGVLVCQARAMGEFGAVSVISGRISGETNTIPLHVQALYDGYDIQGAFAVSLLLASVTITVMIARSVLEHAQDRRLQRGAQAIQG